MMNEGMIRQQLDEIRDALKRNEEEKEVLLSLLRGYEGWLRLHPITNETSHQPAFPAMTVERRKTTPAPKGGRSYRQIVLEVVRDARGEPLHAHEIWRRAQALGGKTESANPDAITDLVLYGHKKVAPVEKVGPRTWRWIGDLPAENGSQSRGATGTDPSLNVQATIHSALPNESLQSGVAG